MNLVSSSSEPGEHVVDMKLALLDSIVLFIYVFSIVLFGSWFVKRNRNAEAFTSARHSVPGWAVGLSIFGTYVSSISFLALPGKALVTNWNPFVFSLGLPVAAWFAVKFFVPFYRKGGDISAYSHLEKRFGVWARTYAGGCYLLTQVARMGSVMYLLALPLHQLLDWDVRLIIIGTGLLVTVFTMLGGIEGVIWTDALQSVILIVGALACAVLIPLKMPGGPPQLFHIAAEHGKFSLGTFSPSLAESTFWVVLVYSIVINLQNFGIDQSYVQRYLVAKSDRDARRSVWLGALLYLPVSAVFFFIGSSLFAFYSVNPDLLPEAIQLEVARGKGDTVFPYYIVHELPAGMTGLLIAAIFSAAVSTLSTSLNCSATLTLTDLYQRYLRPKTSEKESMAVLYLSTLCWGVLGTVVALAMIRVQSALDAWWQLSGIFGGGMLGLFLLGIVSRRANNPVAVTSVLIGILVIVWMTFSPKWEGGLEALRSPFHSFMTIVVGTLAILLCGLLFSRFCRRPNAGAYESS